MHWLVQTYQRMWARWVGRWSTLARAWPSWDDRKKLFSMPTTTTTTTRTQTRIWCLESSSGWKTCQSLGREKTLERGNVTLFTSPLLIVRREKEVSRLTSSTFLGSRIAKSSIVSRSETITRENLLTQSNKLVSKPIVSNDDQHFHLFDRKGNRNKNEFLLMQPKSGVSRSGSQESSSSSKAEKTLARPIVRNERN